MNLPRRNHSSSTRLASAIVALSCKQERGTSHSWSVEKAPEGEESVVVVYDSNKTNFVFILTCCTFTHFALLVQQHYHLISWPQEQMHSKRSMITKQRKHYNQEDMSNQPAFLCLNVVHLWLLLSSGVLIQCSTPHSKLPIFAQSNRGKRILWIAFDFLSKVNCFPAAAAAAMLAPCCELPASAPWLHLTGQYAMHAIPGCSVFGGFCAAFLYTSLEISVLRQLPQSIPCARAQLLY